MAERFLANYTTATRQLSPVDPFVFHPVINRRSANHGKANGFLDRQKLRVFVAVVAEEERHWGVPSFVSELTTAHRPGC
jgi:hypothetical protein